MVPSVGGRGIDLGSGDDILEISACVFRSLFVVVVVVVDRLSSGLC